MIMEYLQSVFTGANNQFVNGAIAAWLLGVLTWSLRATPKALYELIYQSVTCKLYLYNGGWYSLNGDEFKAFTNWFNTLNGPKYYRAMAIDDDNGTRSTNTGYQLSIGYGRTYFVYKRRLFWIDKAFEKTNSGQQSQTVTITCLTLRRSAVEELFEEFRYRDILQEGVRTYTFNHAEKIFARAHVAPKRPIDSVVLSNGIVENLIACIEEHNLPSSREWAMRRGLPYKLTIALHGRPGTGKTSLVRTLAAHFNKGLYVLRIGELTDASLGVALAAIPAGSWLLLEDFDSSKALHKRDSAFLKPKKKVKKEDGKDDDDDESVTEREDYSGLTLSGFLNAMDGVVPLNDMVIFMTTNCLDVIDRAVYRKGRVDSIYEVPYMDHDTIITYIRRMYDIEPAISVTLKEMPGCDAYDMFRNNKTDPSGFIRDLLEYQTAETDSDDSWRFNHAPPASVALPVTVPVDSDDDEDDSEVFVVAN